MRKLIICKKYVFKIELISDKELLIPEFSIELLNKSKKLINKVENLKDILIVKKKFKERKSKKNKKKVSKENRKTKTKKKLRTLWVRRKKS